MGTDGRHGETPADLAEGEALHDRRKAETERSAEILGVQKVYWLGYHDSGMTGWPQNKEPNSFIGADVEVAAQALAKILQDEQADVFTCYDWHGGYGHPDHIMAHRVTTAAVAAVADRWRVPKFYWTVVSTNAFRAGLEALQSDDVLGDWVWPTDFGSFGFSEDRITAVVDAPQYVEAKAAAMRAHATQIDVGPTGRAFALSNKLILPVLGQEHYVLVSGKAGDVDERGWETDLLAGLDL
jgi:N-acetyl-1-D-myo-inositol-2-amino-2-deoxy-alpha-D-glucopyranoside deacetylase